MDRIQEFSHTLMLKMKKSYEQGLDENFLVLLLVVIVLMSVMTLLGQQIIALFTQIVDGFTF